MAASYDFDLLMCMNPHLRLYRRAVLDGIKYLPILKEGGNTT